MDAPRSRPGPLLGLLCTIVVTAIVAYSVGAIFADIWLPWLGDDFGLRERDRYTNGIGLFLSGITLIFTVAAWYGSPRRRFETLFWSGLTLLCVSLIYVCHLTAQITGISLLWLSPGIIDREPNYDLFLGPVLSEFTTALGVILILGAIVIAPTESGRSGLGARRETAKVRFS